MPTPTFFRRLVPALLLASLALASCGQCKDRDPRPRNSNKCGNGPTATPPTMPTGNS